MATKISLKQLGKDILDYIKNGGGTGSGSLDKDITSNVVVGAAPANTLFPEGQTLTEFAEKILRKDITPTLNVNIANSGIKEVGTTINGTTITASIGNESQVTVPINEIKFYKGNTLLETKPYVKGSTYTYVYGDPITTNTTFKVELIYNTNSKIEKSGNFTFVYASYYGITQLSSLTDNNVGSLIPTFTKNVTDKKGLVWSNITLNDARFCYMYPRTYGTLASIKDGNNFEQLQSYTRYEINITSPINGDVVAYYAYLLTDSATGSGFKQTYA